MKNAFDLLKEAQEHLQRSYIALEGTQIQLAMIGNTKSAQESIQAIRSKVAYIETDIIDLLYFSQQFDRASRTVRRDV